MASLSTCHLGLWLGWQILLNLVKRHKKHTFYSNVLIVVTKGMLVNRGLIACSITGWYHITVAAIVSWEMGGSTTPVAQLTLPSPMYLGEYVYM